MVIPVGVGLQVVCPIPCLRARFFAALAVTTMLTLFRMTRWVYMPYNFTVGGARGGVWGKINDIFVADGQ